MHNPNMTLEWDPMIKKIKRFYEWKGDLTNGSCHKYIIYIFKKFKINFKIYNLIFIILFTYFYIVVKTHVNVKIY